MNISIMIIETQFLLITNNYINNNLTLLTLNSITAVKMPK